MIALLKYGSGMPFYRLEKMEQLLGIPLPASELQTIDRRISEIRKQTLAEHLGRRRWRQRAVRIVRFKCDRKTRCGN